MGRKVNTGRTQKTSVVCDALLFSSRSIPLSLYLSLCLLKAETPAPTLVSRDRAALNTKVVRTNQQTVLSSL